MAVTESVYYPSCVVHFRLRFDEALILGNVPDGKANTGVDAGVAVSAPSTPQPLIMQTGDDNLTRLLNRIPKSASVELPGYRQAGTFSLTFDWKELPIDPRFIRSMGVTIHLGAVDPNDFATGMVTVDQATGRRRSVLSTTGPGRSGVPDTTVMVGLVDNWSANWDEGLELTIEGRDLRGTLLDSPLDPKELSKLDLKQPITLVVRDIIKTHPYGELMHVDVSADEWPGGKIPSPAVVKGLTRVRRGARGKGAKSRPAGGAKLSYWDMITQYCFLVGAIPWFQGNRLTVRPARNIYDQTRKTADYSGSAFRDSGVPVPRRDDQGTEFAHRRMVYGRDVESLAFERKMGGTKVPVIEVVAIDTSNKKRGLGKLLRQQFPPKDKKTARKVGVAPSGKVAATDIHRIPIRGIRDKEQLLRVAQDLYEEIGRGELGGNCSTKSLASFGGGNSDTDLVRLRPGDLIEFVTDTRALNSRIPLVSERIDHDRRSFEDQVKEVRKAMATNTGTPDENLARVLVATSRGAVAAEMRFFRTANVKFDWSADAGLGVSFDFQNYIVARADVVPKSGKKTFERQSAQTGRSL